LYSITETQSTNLIKTQIIHTFSRRLGV
jgi:hypothetical protein